MNSHNVESFILLTEENLKEKKLQCHINRYGEPKCGLCGVKANLILKCRVPHNANTEKSFNYFLGYKLGNDIRAFNIDHIIPKSWGGSNSRLNTQLTCEPCNLNKRNTLSKSELINSLSLGVDKTVCNIEKFYIVMSMLGYNDIIKRFDIESMLRFEDRYPFDYLFT